MTTPITGINGAVDGVPGVVNWNVSETPNLQSRGNSSVAGSVITKTGVKDWSGTYEAEGGAPVHMPGETFTFTGSADGSVGATGPAIVESVTINWDWENDAMLGHSVNFAGNGALTRGVAAAVDASVTIPTMSSVCDIMTGTLVAVPVWTALEHLRTASLTITAANTLQKTSDTAGWTKRNAGPVTANGSISVFTDSPANPLDPGDENGLKMYVSATAFWQLLWAKWGEMSDIRVDTNTGDILGCTLNFQFTAAVLIATVATKGSITEPDTNVFWGS